MFLPRLRFGGPLARLRSAIARAGYVGAALLGLSATGVAQATPTAQAPRAPSAAVLRLSDAVVTIVAYRDGGTSNVATGTGFRIADGRIVSALRHFRGATRADVFNAFGDLLATVTTLDQAETRLDLAVLPRVDVPGEKLTVARRSATLAQHVTLLGPRKGETRTAIDRTITAVEPDDRGRPLLRLGAAVALTSVGAPVVNARGEVIGVALGGVPGRDDADIAVDVSALREVLARPGAALRFPSRDGTMAAAPAPAPAPDARSPAAARSGDASRPRAAANPGIFPASYGAPVGGDTARTWGVELFGCARLDARQKVYCYLRITNLGAGGTFEVKGADLADSTRRRLRSAETLVLGETRQRLSGWRAKAGVPLRELESARIALEFTPPEAAGNAVRLMVDVAGERALWFGPLVLQRVP